MSTQLSVILEPKIIAIINEIDKKEVRYIIKKVTLREILFYYYVKSLLQLLYIFL